MPHVTFVHGILNKPPKEELLHIWKLALATASVPFDLDAAGVSCDMVYWADVLYEKPEETDLIESSGPSEMVLNGVSEDLFDIDPSQLGDESERAWVSAMSRTLGLPTTDGSVESGEEATAPPGTMAEELERIPLPWLVKRAFMKAFLRDVHHYLFNESFSPRIGETYKVQDEIRARFVDAIAAGNKTRGPHLVVSHSMGTVIAYDCLKRVPECNQIDHFITLGSPLGIDEIQDRLQPGWTRDDGFPSAKVTGEWLNYFDPKDVVSRLDPYLANDYRRDSHQVIDDNKQVNMSPGPHDLSGYMRGQYVSKDIQRLIG